MTIDDKATLRRQFRARRAAHVAALADRRPAELALADLVSALLASLVQPAPLAAYVPIGDEIDPDAAGVATLLPRAGPQRRLSFHRARVADCRPAGFGLREPPLAAPEEIPAVLLVPLLAATPSGQRLGQGGGYYDRWLAAARGRQPVVAIGVGWDVQVTDRLPADPWDQPLDWVATPTRLFDCRLRG